VLDRHVLDYFRLALGANAESAVLGRLSGYERIETEFQRVATAFGHSVGCVDLALWVTMRVAKREAMR
jgi:N-glycosylase/DNA lyase